MSPGVQPNKRMQKPERTAVTSPVTCSESSEQGIDEGPEGLVVMTPPGENQDNASFHSLPGSPSPPSSGTPVSKTRWEPELDRAFEAQARRGKWVYTSFRTDGWNVTEETLENLSKGLAGFHFACRVGDQLNEDDLTMLTAGINISSFADEVRDNGVPRLDVRGVTVEELRSNTFVMVRGMYFLPGVDLHTMDVATVCSVPYQRACQPSSRTLPTTIWDDCASRGDHTTFRITKALIPFVMKITIQFKVTELPRDVLPRLSIMCGGLQVDRALLLERTKRGGPQSAQDYTRKVKSFIMFHRVPSKMGGGVLVINATLIANTFLPGSIAQFLTRVGTLGAGELADTATRTQRYLMANRSPATGSPATASPAS
eukprot:Hpha_TRINITY_DN15705_c2_g20::TRINITY_DN15705_c2_g20_i1::g.42141::m.42141